MTIYNSMLELIGSTPLVKLNMLEKKHCTKAHLLAKIESCNPGGSVKDRAAFFMIKDAMDNHKITNDTYLVEPTSGNTGIGLAMVCSILGIRLVITLPESMSVERRQILKAYGAQLILTPAELGMKGAIAKAEQIVQEDKNALCLGQFSNMANVQAHYLTTGPEIFNATDGKVDYLVSGVGTGGTISGTGKYLKEKLPNIKVVAVEPKDSPVLSGGKAGAHKIQGIGAGFIPPILDTKIYDQIIQVSNEDALSTGKSVCQCEGLFCGISSGAALHAALQIAKKEENAGKNIVVIIPDSADRYLSTPLFD